MPGNGFVEPFQFPQRIPLVIPRHLITRVDFERTVETANGLVEDFVNFPAVPDFIADLPVACHRNPQPSPLAWMKRLTRTFLHKFAAFGDNHRSLRIAEAPLPL